MIKIMKTMVLIIAFAIASINMMQTDMRTVEIAQMQRNSPTMMADDARQVPAVQLAAR